MVCVVACRRAEDTRPLINKLSRPSGRDLREALLSIFGDGGAAQRRASVFASSPSERPIPNSHWRWEVAGPLTRLHRRKLLEQVSFWRFDGPLLAENNFCVRLFRVPRPQR